MLQCTKRLREICYIQCIHVIAAIVDLVQVSEIVLSELAAGTLNKQNESKDRHTVIFDGSMG